MLRPDIAHIEDGVEFFPIHDVRELVFCCFDVEMFFPVVFGEEFFW